MKTAEQWAREIICAVGGFWSSEQERLKAFIVSIQKDARKRSVLCLCKKSCDTETEHAQQIGGYALSGLALEDLGSAELDYLAKVWRQCTIPGSIGRANNAVRILKTRNWSKRRQICLEGRSKQFPNCMSANEQILKSAGMCACAKKLAQYFIDEGKET